jgi:hypothetical protein
MNETTNRNMPIIFKDYEEPLRKSQSPKLSRTEKLYRMHQEK